MTSRQPAETQGANSHSAHTPPGALTDKDNRPIDSRLVCVRTRRFFCKIIKKGETHAQTLYL